MAEAGQVVLGILAGGVVLLALVVVVVAETVLGAVICGRGPDEEESCDG